MDEHDLLKLQELTLLLDLAYAHFFKKAQARYKSAEGSIRLEFGSYWYRNSNRDDTPRSPQIESVVIYSSPFSANTLVHFDTLDDAIDTVRVWYNQAKENAQT